jgi:hypothetical protein
VGRHRLGRARRRASTRRRRSGREHLIRRSDVAGLALLAAVTTAVLAPAPVAAPLATTALTATVTNGRIAIAEGEGSGSRVLGTGRESFVSPDGEQVAVLDYDIGPAPLREARNHRLELYAASGGAPTRVLRVQTLSVHWSPDSRKLALVDQVPDLPRRRGRLLVVDAANGAATTLVRGFLDSQVSFSPDSRQLAYVQFPSARSAGGRLLRIDLGSKRIVTVRTRSALAPVWGPRAIAFSTVTPRRQYGPSLNVAMVAPDGSGFRRLTQFRPNFLQAGLVPVAWSADGRRLLGGLVGQDQWIAYAIDPVRGGSRRISSRLTPSALSRDGEFVVGDSSGGEDFGPPQTNVGRVPWGGGAAHVLLRGAAKPSFNG